MPGQVLGDVPFELVPREARLLLCSTPAGFPSPAQDDMEEPIDLAAWLIDHPAAILGRWAEETPVAPGGFRLVNAKIDR